MSASNTANKHLKKACWVHRSQHTMLETTTRGFSWVMAVNFGHFLELTYCWFKIREKQQHNWACSARSYNLKDGYFDEGGQKPWKFRNCRQQIRWQKPLQSIKYSLQLSLQQYFSSVGLCTTLVDHYIACKKHKHFGIKHLASFSLMLAQYHFIFIFETQLQWFGYRIFKMNFYDLLISLSSNLRYRRYYMATWIYKISV